MSYGDDQCEECGAVRVSGSRLCVGCLIKQLDRERRKKEVLQSITDKRDLEIARLNVWLKDSLDYGYKKNRENIKLLQYIKHLELQDIRRWINETDVERENSEE